MVNQLKRTSFLLAAFALGGVSAAAQSGGLARPESTGRIIEEIVVRVNNEIITRSDLERARQTLRREIEEQDCRGCPRDQVEAMFREREKDLVRDLVDQQLLVQRGKDAGLTVEADVVRRLDQIRQRNNFATMEDLERAVASSGTPFEDFKAGIRNQLLTEEVIRREVGPRIRISREEVKKYYDEHQKDFHRLEQVFLREIFVTTEGKSEEELPALEKKANDLIERVKRGEDFGELAKRFSDGSTAAQGGELGVFERGQLAKDFEDVVFKMNRGQMTEVIRTSTGFLVLRVEQRYEPGLQPLEKVEIEIQNRIYGERMQPELRAFLKQLREESYVMLKAGYVDSAASSSSPIEEVPFQTEEDKKKEKKEKKKKSGE